MASLILLVLGRVYLLTTSVQTASGYVLNNTGILYTTLYCITAIAAAAHYRRHVVNTELFASRLLGRRINPDSRCQVRMEAGILPHPSGELETRGELAPDIRVPPGRGCVLPRPGCAVQVEIFDVGVDIETLPM